MYTDTYNMKDKDTPEYLPGFFLIADTELRDPNFYRTVVLLVEHNGDGAFGLVTNRLSNACLGSVLPEVEDSPLRDYPVYVGGPVQREYLFLLHGGIPGRPQAEHSYSPCAGVVYEPVTNLLIQELLNLWDSLSSEEISKIRFFAGYSGWGAGQLEEELLSGSWITVSASQDVVFLADPEKSWEIALDSKGGIYSVIARTGFKPSLN